MNENDSVATDEIGEKFGDNDELSAEVAKLVNADKLIILTDIDGVFTDNPFKNKDAKLIHSIEKIDEKTLKLATEHSSTKSRGGMKSKLKASKVASEAGIDLIKK